MIAPPRPLNEDQRLRALQSLSVLDTPPEERFDRITRLAARIFDVPIALVSLVDSDRQWFKSCVGLSAKETPRSISFCGHAVLSDDVFIVPDAAQDARFADNPLVTGEPYIRFYAGQPLLDANDHRLGTLCLIDRRPRTLSEAERRTLLDLSRIAGDEMAQISLNRTNARLGRREEDLKRFLEDAHDLIQSVTPDGRFTFVNRAWREALGYREEEVGALSLFDVIHPESRAHCMEAFQRVLSGQAVANVEATFVTKAGRTIRVQGNANGRVGPDGVCVTQSIFRDITERTRADEALTTAQERLEELVRERTSQLAGANAALLESEARVRGVIEHAPDGIVVADAGGKILVVNGQTEALFGYRREEMIGRSVEMLLPERVREDHIGHRSQFAADPTTRPMGNGRTLSGRRNDGSEFPVEISLAPLPTAEGLLVMSSIRDITERKRMERFQATQHQVQELIVTGGALPEILRTLALGIEEQNTAMVCSVLLLDEDGQHLLQGAAPHLPEAYNRAIDGVAIGPSVGSCGTAAYRGERVIVTDIATDPLWADYKDVALQHDLRACWSEPILSAGRHVLGSFAIYYREPKAPGAWELFLIERAARLAGIAIEQRRTEAALKRSHDELERRVLERTAEAAAAHAQVDRFFTLALDIICLAGFDGTFKKLNPAWEHVLGYSTDELLSRPFLDFVHPEDRPATAAEAAKLAQGGVTVAFENRYRRKDGTYRWFLWAATTHVETETIYAVARDITERKALESLLRARNDELKAFSYTVSHDLKAPLRGITGYAQELIREHNTGLADRAMFCLDQIVTASNNLSHLIEDLLHYSQLDRETPTITDLDLNEMVSAILKDREPIIAEQQTDLSVAMPLTRVRGWEQGMRQVLANLIDNALKYSRKAASPRVEIQGKESPDWYRITVTDNGIGFDMKYHDRIFGLFNRLVRQDEFEGTGAGLAIVKKVIDKMGGRVWAESAKGQGATFFAEWPKKSSVNPNG
ncbi:MAG: PAS domain S-box protein [Nitrospirota bacterium]